MQIQRRLAPLVAFSLIAIVALIASCGDKGTNPQGGSQAKELDSGRLPNGRVYVHTFANAGTFDYFCEVHGAAAMSGSVVVGGTTDSALVVIGPGDTYTPATASVKVGGPVRWINQGSTHTVTSK